MISVTQWTPDIRRVAIMATIRMPLIQQAAVRSPREPKMLPKRPAMAMPNTEKTSTVWEEG